MKKFMIIAFVIGMTTVLGGCAHHYHNGPGYNAYAPAYHPRHYGYSGYRRPYYGYPPVSNRWRGHHHHGGYGHRPYY